MKALVVMIIPELPKHDISSNEPSSDKITATVTLWQWSCLKKAQNYEKSNVCDDLTVLRSRDML